MRFLRAAVAPLVSRSTYRRLMFLLVGSSAALLFTALATVFLLPMMGFAEGSDAAFAALLAVPMVPVQPMVIAVGLLRSALGVQRNLARLLLGVSIPDLPEGADVSWSHRWRSAGFFAAHVMAGYLYGLGVVALLGFTVVTVAVYADPAAAQNPEVLRFGPVVVLVVAVALVYGAALLGAAFSYLADRLLGATPDERMAVLQHRIRNLAEHNRLARELHDSVGHALSVVSVQASAAQRVFDRDPEVARSALTAISDCARRALNDLDHVLALLREEHDAAGPQSTLANLDDLIADVTAAGLTVRLDRSDGLERVPAVVSREAYRIIQEGLTNALRYAGPVPVTLTVCNDDKGLRVDVSNPIVCAEATEATAATAADGPPERTGGGRGLTGIRERVTLLGGSVSAGPYGGRWVLSVSVPPILVPEQPRPRWAAAR